MLDSKTVATPEFRELAIRVGAWITAPYSTILINHREVGFAVMGPQPITAKRVDLILRAQTKTRSGTEAILVQCRQFQIVSVNSPVA